MMKLGADDERTRRSAKEYGEAIALLAVKVITRRFLANPSNCGIYTETQEALAREMVDARFQGFPISIFMNAAISLTPAHVASRSGLPHDKGCHVLRSMR